MWSSSPFSLVYKLYTFFIYTKSNLKGTTYPTKMALDCHTHAWDFRGTSFTKTLNTGPAMLPLSSMKLNEILGPY